MNLFDLELYENCLSNLENYIKYTELNYKFEINELNLKILLRYILSNLPQELLLVNLSSKLFYCSNLTYDQINQILKPVSNYTIKDIEDHLNFVKKERIKRLTSCKFIPHKKYNDQTQSNIDKCNKIIQDANELSDIFSNDKIIFYRMIRTIRKNIIR